MRHTSSHPSLFTPARKTWLWAVLLGLGASQAAWAACPDNLTKSRPNGRYELLGAAGKEVRDTTTGLIWQRCVLGKVWNAAGAPNTCSGTATTAANWQAALAAANTAVASTLPDATVWRLPNLSELSSLIARECTGPAINTTAFPGATSDAVWSSTPSAANREDAWYVAFFDGSNLTTYKANNTLQMRLVRSSPSSP